MGHVATCLLQLLAARVDAGRAIATAAASLRWRCVLMALPPLTTKFALTTDDADADADNADGAAQTDQKDPPCLETLVLPVEDKAWVS